MTEREQFEAWASDNNEWPQCIERSGDSYKLMQTKLKWEAWQAARAQPAQAVPITSESGNQDTQGASGITSVPVLTDEQVAAMRAEHGWAKDTIRAIEQAVRAKMGVPQWLPIETAPMDERVLLVGRSRRPFLGIWDDYDKYNHPKITHWMPLPPPPGIVGKEGA